MAFSGAAAALAAAFADLGPAAALGASAFAGLAFTFTALAGFGTLAFAALATRAPRPPLRAARSAAFSWPSGEARYSRRSASSSWARSGVRSAWSSPRRSEALVSPSVT